MAIDKKYFLKEDGIHVIGSHYEKLNPIIADEEKHEYSIIDRDSEIDNLCMWISECETDDKILMKKDLKTLLNWDDDCIFTSNSTNSYVGQNCKRFNDICEELFEINKTL